MLGFAWMVGALSAFEAETGIHPRDARYVIGTSAGSVVAALLACGLSVEQLRRHHQGVSRPEDPQISWDYEDSAGGSLPPRPRLRPGSPRLLVNAVRHPRRMRPLVAVSGALPAGRGTLAPLQAMLDGVSEAGGYGASWPTSPRPWVVTTDYRTGRRVVFGREQTGRLSEAVVGSCSIPGWYQPAVIGTRRYVDGGVYSNTSLDLLLGTTVEQVYAFVPMATTEALGRAATVAGRAERAVRRAITRTVVADVERLRADGKAVTLLSPGAADLDVMGLNLMNAARRSEVLQTAITTTTTALRPAPASGHEDNPASGWRS
jgi:NTE family protein